MARQAGRWTEQWCEVDAAPKFNAGTRGSRTFMTAASSPQRALRLRPSELTFSSCGSLDPLLKSNARDGPIDVANFCGRQRIAHQLVGFRVSGLLRRRTPGPPPSSSINSTPASSRTRRTAKSLAAVSDVSPSVSSARRMVRRLTVDSHERSAAVRPMAGLLSFFREGTTERSGLPLR